MEEEKKQETREEGWHFLTCANALFHEKIGWKGTA